MIFRHKPCIHRCRF